MIKFIKLNALIPADDCYDEQNRRYVNSTILRRDSIIGVSVSHAGYVYIRLMTGEDLRVEVNNSLCENTEDYSDVLLHRLTALSN